MTTEPLELLSFVAPAGRHTYRLSTEAVGAEKLAWAISGLSLVAILGWAAAHTMRSGARTQLAQRAVDP